MKHGKKYTDAAKLIDRSVQYDSAEAIALVKKSATAKFDETIEAHIRLGVDGRHADQQVRGAVVLPNGTGKTVKVLVFAKGAKLDEAQAAGADYVGGEELIPKIQNDGWFDFDVVVATPDMMGVVEKRMADVLRVDANLMRAASFQTVFVQRDVTETFQNVPVRDGFLAVIAVGVDGHFAAVADAAPDIAFNGAVVLVEIAPNQGVVTTVDVMLEKLSGEDGLCGLVFCHQKQSCRVLVDTVNEITELVFNVLVGLLKMKGQAVQ